MALDFWNNPIIVSAFRVKYRKGNVLRSTGMYLLVLAVIGAVMEHYNDRMGGGWIHKYYLTLMGIQFLASALLATGATAASIKAEVVSRTLDFQRIAALSPRQILFGKLFGEPAQAYLLAIASVPLAVFCWLLGGVSFDVLVIMYVNLATTTLLFGAMGLGNRLEPPAGQADASFIGLLGLFSPAPVFNAMRHDNPWDYSVDLFGQAIPWLLVLPIVQLLMAYLCFQMMERRLLNPLLPPNSKRLAYGLLILADVIIAGVLTIPLPLVPVWSLSARWSFFCLFHLAVCLLLITAVSPFKETLHDWVWRYRGRRSRLWDLWLGERSANGLVLVIFCVMGILGVGLGVLLPAGLEDITKVRREADQIAAALALMCLLILALGTLHQRAVLLAGRNGAGAIVLVAILLDLPAHLVGQYYGLDRVLAFSPSAHFLRWKDGNPPLSLLPVLGLYGLLFALCAVSLYGRLHRLERIVDDKLRLMGVRKPAVAAEGV